MNYIQQSEAMIESVHRELNMSILQQLQEESTFIFESMYNFTHVLEATTPTKNNKNILSKFMEFIKTLMSSFTSKLNMLVKNHKPWLEANKKEFEERDYSGVSIEITPYWLGKTTDYGDLLIAQDVILGTNLKDMKVRADKQKEDIKRQYGDKDGNVKAGMKNFMRHGDAKSETKTVILDGNKLKERVLREFYPYCLNYENQTKIVKEAERRTTAMIKTLNQRVDRIEKTATVEESYFLIENAFGHEVLPLQTLLEADKDRKPTEVIINKDDNSFKRKEFTDKVDRMDSTDLALARELISDSQFVIATLLTVLEEKYTTYFKVLRGLSNAGTKAKDESPEKEKKEEEKVSKPKRKKRR